MWDGLGGSCSSGIGSTFMGIGGGSLGGDIGGNGGKGGGNGGNGGGNGGHTGGDGGRGGLRGGTRGGTAGGTRGGTNGDLVIVCNTSISLSLSLLSSNVIVSQFTSENGGALGVA